jgi:hypothetical protein
MFRGPLAERFPKGSRIVRFNPSVARSMPTHLTDDFFAAADPQISFDGSKILFSGQRLEGEPWQLWEMDLDGSNKRQITHCGENCLRGAYLPADEIVFTIGGANEKRTHSYLAVAKMDGSELRSITFGPAAFWLETVLRDGRIIASAPWPLTASQGTDTERLLYTLRPDGTALESFRCSHGEAAIRTEAEELEDGSLVFVRSSGKTGKTGGELVRVQQGALQEMPLGSPQAVYVSARQLSGEELVVSKATTNSSGSAEKYDLYTFRLNSKTLGERLFADAHLSSIQAVPVVRRTVPKHYWNTLNPESKTGNFISLNSYLSADAPNGRIASHISQVRVFTVDSSDGKERSLGEAPVEADGSFFVRVPANWPIRFALLDAKGQVIREEHSWVWARPGEQRGCTGCHGDKAVAPENHWPLTLRRFDTPIAMGDADHASTTSRAK